MARPIRVEKAESNAKLSKILDFRFGYTLFRDRRVPLTAKCGAFAIAIAAVVLFEVFELPIEELVALALPIVGILGDVTFAGTEAVVGPIMIACLLLPHLTPSTIVNQIRRDRSRSPEKPIIDV